MGWRILCIQSVVWKNKYSYLFEESVATDEIDQTEKSIIVNTIRQEQNEKEQELFKLSKTMCKLTTKVAAYDGKNLWVTGKNCPQIYKIKF